MLLGTQALIGVWVMWLAEGARSRRTRDRYVTGDEKQEASFILKVLKRHKQRRFKPQLDRISEAANSTLERSGEKQMWLIMLHKDMGAYQQAALWSIV